MPAKSVAQRRFMGMVRATQKGEMKNPSPELKRAAGDMSAVWTFSDAMILALVFPNMIGLMILYPTVKEELNRYISATSRISDS